MASKPDFTKFINTLNTSKIQQTNNPLYQCINGIISTSQQAVDYLSGLIPVSTDKGETFVKLLKKQYVFNNDQIKSSPTIPLVISPLPPPTVGARVSIWKINCLLDTTNGAYTNIGANCFAYLRYQFPLQQFGNFLGDDPTLTPPRTYFSSTFGTTNKTWWEMGKWEDTVETNQWGNMAQPILLTDSMNKVVEFFVQNENPSIGNFADGDPRNSLKINTYYLIELP